MRRAPSWITGLLCLAAAVAHADTVSSPPDLPPRDVVVRWLTTDPVVREADIGRSAAAHEAGMLRASPNEWTLTATGQRRSYETDERSREWNVGLERTVRLPGKRRLDSQLGEQAQTLAQARYEASLRQSLIDLVGLWFDWVGAVEGRRLAERQVELARANGTHVDKRVKAGDAARLDLNLAEADLADVERVLSEARTTEVRAHARLIARFPDVPPTAPALSEPPLEPEAATDRIARLMDTSAALAIATAERADAELGVSRQRADRLPDPTLGVFNASEAFGNERIIGVSLSIPLPGRYRDQKLARALDTRDQRDAALAQVTQRLRAEAADLVATDQMGAERWQLARTAAQRSEENARLSQRAYALGETDLQTVLLARRQSLDSARTALDAHIAALQAHYRWLLESRSLWADLSGAAADDHDTTSPPDSGLRLP